jgi:signal transduction histidine kinase
VAIEKAKEADRLKSQFLANMSHDLRSPLNSILCFSELLLTGIDGELAHEHCDLIQIINDSGHDLLQQIDDILDTAKIEAGKMEIHPEPTPTATLVSRAIQNARKRLRKDIDFHTEAAPGLPPTVVDTYRAVQAVENVLLFASERMESGTITVNVRTDLGERGHTIAIQVRTPVRPASAEQLRQARQGFTRLPGHKGLGLGLPIANAIAEMHGGRLEIDDGDEAMVFTIHFPAPDLRRVPRMRLAGT